MIIFLKSTPAAEPQMPLRQKLLLTLKQRVKDAKDDEDRVRAKRDLQEFEKSGSAAE